MQNAKFDIDTLRHLQSNATVAKVVLISTLTYIGNGERLRKINDMAFIGFDICHEWRHYENIVP